MQPWKVYQDRYRRGEWRAPIFRDMILQDVRQLGRAPVLLDIGCGSGFDGDLRLQQSLASAAKTYIGIEPDSHVELATHFSESYRCLFEDCPLKPASIDLAFAVMVLEHLREPGSFWRKLYEVLAAGGIFWGFTMDRRHWFCDASLWAKRLGIKEMYLNLLSRRPGKPEGRYKNYPVYYLSNSESQLKNHVAKFSACEFINFGRVGQLDNYFPRPLRTVGRLLDRLAMARSRPGTLLAIRVRK
jgi:SAM-dependent methyltransferase